MHTCFLMFAVAVMADLGLKHLGVTECRFVPTHVNNLANEFQRYTNYNSAMLTNYSQQ